MTRVISIKCEIDEGEDDLMRLNMERFCEIPDGSYLMSEESSNSNILPSVNTLFDIQSQTGETKLNFTVLTNTALEQCDNYLDESTKSEEYYNNQYVHNDQELNLEFYEEENEDCLVPTQFLKSEKTNSSNELNIGEALECRWEDCWWLFKSQSDLVKHIEQEHVEPKRGDEFPCMWQHCPRRFRPFNARYKLLIHMRVHSGEKPNKCQFAGCMKAFSRLENLKIHQRSHTGERPYSCQYATCSKAFSNSSDRAKHQRTHFDTKPYGCQISGCNKKYTDPSSLRKHLKNHSGQSVTTKPKKLIASEPKVSAAELQSRCTPLIIYKEEDNVGRVSKIDDDTSERRQFIDHFNYSSFINLTSIPKKNEGDAKSVADSTDIGGYDNELEECTLDSDTEREFLDLERLETTSLFPLNEEDLISSFT